MKTPEQDIADTFGAPDTTQKPVPTFVESADRRDQDFSSRRTCEGCGRERSFDQRGRLRMLVQIDGQPWHLRCFKVLHPGRTA